MTETAENNDRAVVLSEEVDFLEELVTHEGIPPDDIRAILERRDQVREAMATAESPGPLAEPEEGTPLPEEAEELDLEDPDDA